ncbi:hypothetical protein [Dipodfec virus UOA04_Rod_565]|nr:hypothetical protein [Dipodfec virus UOA04_Rod_565]
MKIKIRFLDWKMNPEVTMEKAAATTIFEINKRAKEIKERLGLGEKAIIQITIVNND